MPFFLCKVRRVNFAISFLIYVNDNTGISLVIDKPLIIDLKPPKARNAIRA